MCRWVHPDPRRCHHHHLFLPLLKIPTLVWPAGKTCNKRIAVFSQSLEGNYDNEERDRSLFVRKALLTDAAYEDRHKRSLWFRIIPLHPGHMIRWGSVKSRRYALIPLSLENRYFVYTTGLKLLPFSPSVSRCKINCGYALLIWWQ